MTITKTKSKTDYDLSSSSEWIQSFRKKYGRSPRMLHIGNIANNAYNNAKLLNKAGLDCDVICYDYYHIMGCPEWEDADFDEGEINDQFSPNWGLVNLNGFKRPRWFVQGLQKLCIDYLITKISGGKVRQDMYWRLLSYENKTVKGGKSVIKYKELSLLTMYKIVDFLRRLMSVVYSENTLDKIKENIQPLNKKFFGITKILKIFQRNPIKITTILISRVLTLPLLIPTIVLNIPKYLEYRIRVKLLIKSFKSVFPDRSDILSSGDLATYQLNICYWEELFQYYDIVQAYSTDPILPLLAGKPYFAFEHGTLRSIPFQQDREGRITAISYNFAEHVFVTNADCLANARKLAGDRITFINHPYDEDHGLGREGGQELRQELLRTLDSDFLFFFPTRHDWVPGTGYADKGNDIFLRSFVRLRSDGYRVGMVCCQWGSNVRQSKDLLIENNCSDYVCWIEPMGTVRFERMARACDIVVDQFKLGAFGGVLFKSMAMGSPICTYLDEVQMCVQYADVPPVVNCKTEEEIITRMRKIIEDPSVLEDMSEASRKWIKKYYSSAETVNAQLSRYKEYFEKYKII